MKMQRVRQLLEGWIVATLVCTIVASMAVVSRPSVAAGGVGVIVTVHGAQQTYVNEEPSYGKTAMQAAVIRQANRHIRRPALFRWDFPQTA